MLCLPFPNGPMVSGRRSGPIPAQSVHESRGHVIRARAGFPIQMNIKRAESPRQFPTHRGDRCGPMPPAGKLRPAVGLKFKFPARNRTYGSFCGHGLVLARTYGPTTVILQSNISVCKMQGSKRVTSWGSSSEVNTPITEFFLFFGQAF